MRAVLTSKFAAEPLRSTLISTRPHYLEERSAQDGFWGTGKAAAGGIGSNWLGLGVLLMEVREGL